MVLRVLRDSDNGSPFYNDFGGLQEYAKAEASLGRECTEDEKWDIGVKLVRDKGQHPQFIALACKYINSYTKIKSNDSQKSLFDSF